MKKKNEATEVCSICKRIGLRAEGLCGCICEDGTKMCGACMGEIMDELMCNGMQSDAALQTVLNRHAAKA